MENFNIEQWGFVVIIVLLIFGAIMPIFNLIIASIPWKIKWVKLPKYKSKKSPIYKLEYLDYFGYSVSKYELKWKGLYLPQGLENHKEAWFGWAVLLL